MDQQVIIADLENRARAVGVSISRVCADAGVHPTTFSRWKKTLRNPTPIGANLRSLSAIEAALNARERRVRPKPATKARAA